MRRYIASLALGLIGLLALSACATQPAAPVSATAATAGSSDSPIAGRTLRCNTGGPSSLLTFGIDGKLSGRLLQTEVTGTWHSTGRGSIHAHVIAGAVSLRDDLRRTGNRWVGRTTTCVAG